MNKQELRSICSRLFKCSHIDDCKELIDIYSGFLINAVKNHQMDRVDSVANLQAKIILQMIFTKVQHLKSLIVGIHFENDEGVQLSGIIDPVVVGTHIRSTYEMVGIFNLIYRAANSGDEREILHSLWVHAGLKYRQRFTATAKSEVNQRKAKEERETMNQLVHSIEGTTLYEELSETNKQKIQMKLKDSDYHIRFKGDQVIFLHWHELIAVMGIKPGLLDQTYTYFSLYAHPSNVAVFQFGEMFKRGEESYMELTMFGLKCFFIFVSIFIADYIHLFPNVMVTYNGLSIVDQIVINFHNKIVRGNEYSINDSARRLN